MPDDYSPQSDEELQEIADAYAEMEAALKDAEEKLQNLLFKAMHVMQESEEEKVREKLQHLMK